MSPVRCCRYQAIVSSSPAQVGCGRPAEFLAGAAGIQTAPRLSVRFARIPADLALVTAQFTNQLGEVPDTDLAARPDIDGIRFVIAIGCQADRLRCVPHEEEFARGRAGPPDFDGIPIGFLSLDDFADQRRNHVAGLRLEIVSRTVHVHRQQRDGIEAVLGAIRGALHDQHLLGQTVGRVGFLGIAVPQVGFLEGYRGMFRVGADRADRYDLLHFGAPRFLDQVHAHDQIVVEIAARILAVGTNTADDGGQMDDHIRAFRSEHFPYRGRLSQVVLRNAGGHDRGRVESLQSFAHVLPNKAGTTGNQHGAVCENAHDRVSEEVRRMVTVVWDIG